MRWFILILCIPVFMGTHMMHKQLIETLPLKADVNNSVSLFPAEFLQLTSLGHDALNADLLWLQLIQYYGAAVKEDLPITHLYRYFDTLTTLDPHFENGYVFASFLMADKPEQALKIMKKGMRLNPDNSDIFFQAGFISYLYLKDSATAAGYFEKAANIPEPGSNKIAARLAKQLYAKSTDNQNCDVSLRLWRQAIDQAPEGRSRERAEKNFVERRMLCELNILQTQINAYAEREAKDFKQLQSKEDEDKKTEKPASFFPDSLALMLGLKTSPRDPLGRPYVYQKSTGKVFAKNLPWKKLLIPELEVYLVP